AGWLRKLEPLGHGNPEPLFVARQARLLTAPRIMKDRHVCMELVQERSTNQVLGTQGLGTAAVSPGPTGAIRAVGWDLAVRAAALGLAQGSLIDLVYRV